jgi:putative ABC transport system permease protein
MDKSLLKKAFSGIVVYPLELFSLTWMRLWSRIGLTLLALMSIILIVGLLSSSAYFAQAVDRVILGQELAALSQQTGRSPFSTRVYFFPSSQVPLSVEDVERLSHNVADTLSSEVGLPLKHLGIQIESGNMMLREQIGESQYDEGGNFIGVVNLVYIADVENHLEIVVGDPLIAQDESRDILHVWMPVQLAEEMGVQPGEVFRYSITLKYPPRLLKVVGLWQAKEPSNPFWFRDPGINLRDAMLVSRQGYETHVQPTISSGSRLVSWHIILDDHDINPNYAERYARGFERGLSLINKYLPGARLDTAPLEPLTKFVHRQTTLTILLMGFNVPALAFLIYFLMLSSAIIARWQQREIAVLVSRGMSMWGILSLLVIEEALLFIVGIPLGISFGMLLARVMGCMGSFLTLLECTPLPISFQGTNLSLIMIALGIALLARLVPAAQAARQSVIVQEQRHSRPLNIPFWQRYYLDFLLIIPTIYAYSQLSSAGTLAFLVREGVEDLFQDPLLILVPALFVLTAALLVMRLFSLLMNIMNRLAGVIRWVPLHLALRQLGRNRQSYINPLLLIIVSLGLGIYTLSMAASLDQWLVDRMYYRVGTDISFLPYMLSDEGAVLYDVSLIPPKDEFAKLDDVEAVSRVGDYPAEIQFSGADDIRVRFLGVDSFDFPSVAWFRSDFARESLGALMNRLALAPENILIPQQAFDENYVQIGDQLRLWIALDNLTSVASVFTVSGGYDYFPTVYDEEITVIGNLDHLFTLAGSPFPHYLWMRVQPETNTEDLLTSIRKKRIEPSRLNNTQTLITEAKDKMERVGIFGTLSVGFIASATMAVISLLIHSYAALQERFYFFGVMRAIGMKRRQVIIQVVQEYAFLTLFGAISGAIIGGFASRLFTPFFRVTGQEGVPLPPLIPVIAQEEIIRLVLIFTGFLIMIELLIIARVLNALVFRAIRMGHQG